jgi:hypothetical protein
MMLDQSEPPRCATVLARPEEELDRFLQQVRRIRQLGLTEKLFQSHPLSESLKALSTMAQQQDAMETVKEVIRQIIKYRFWISVGVAALFGLIAYSVGSGPVRDQFKKESEAITGAKKNVEQYSAPGIPTKEYQPIVAEKTGVLTGDVNAAWRALYNRQAPLLTWPEPVQERFRKWGREWPKDVDPGKVTLAQIDYIAAYKDYVDMVYKTFNPFDYETGEGIVVAAPKEALLRPAVFSDEKVPGLGKIWAAQERLWIQHTLLEVVKEVNKNAKNWDSAIIREIETMEVGSSIAQDQRSLAKNEELQEAKNILAPGETEETAETAAAPGGGGPMSGMMGAMGGRGGMMGGGAGATQDPQTIYYVKGENDQQFRKLPIMISVLIDQDRVQDFLVELENSPMSIQVMDFELQRPTARVTKPEKGATQFGGMMMGQMGMMGGTMGGSPMRMRGMSGYGGMSGMMMGGQGMMMGGMMGRMSGMGGGLTTARKGTDVRKVDRAKDRKTQEELASKSKGPSFFDPYFDIVQVTVYGQARFFQPPPQDESSQQQPSPGETSAAPDAAATASASPAAAGPDAKTAASPSSTPPATDSEAKASAPAEGEAAAKTDGTSDDAAKSTAPPTGEAAAKKDENADEAGKSAAPSAAPKSDTEKAAPKS